MMEKYAALTGKRPLSVKFNSARTRWGSCNKRTREIRFSRYLLLLPEFCVEHVVAHEMAHLLVANHGPRFYALMNQHFPMWKEAKKATAKIVI
jgi:predicted metal-dependent hydrolase